MRVIGPHREAKGKEMGPFSGNTLEGSLDKHRPVDNRPPKTAHLKHFSSVYKASSHLRTLCMRPLADVIFRLGLQPRGAAAAQPVGLLTSARANICAYPSQKRKRVSAIGETAALTLAAQQGQNDSTSRRDVKRLFSLFISFSGVRSVRKAMVIYTTFLSVELNFTYGEDILSAVLHSRSIGVPRKAAVKANPRIQLVLTEFTG